ncbi:hypothetical protein ONS96_002770 [Cadophora gregata f. sp. sojae]|nr:hypothetical protein ONS96_002770 [Cadophora gregata f. sp. sojae]
MAPEPGILKRQRSRPSDWWAAKPTVAEPAPAPHASATSTRDGDREMQVGENGSEKKKRGRPSAGGGGITEKMAAGNRGRKGNEADTVISNKIGAANREKEKPLRRGRSSAGEADIRALGLGEGEKAQGAKKKAVRDLDVKEATDNEKPSRRGRSSAGEGELKLGQASQAMDTDRTNAMTVRQRGRPAAVVAEEDFVDGSEEQVAPTRRGRPSAAQAEEQVGGLSGEQAKDTTAPKRRSRRSLAAVEDQVEDVLESGNSREEIGSSTRGRHTAASARKQPEERLPDATKKRGRPALPPSESPAKSTSASDNRIAKKRGRPAAEKTPAEIAPELPEPKKKRTRQSDAEIIQPEGESVLNESTPARGRTRHRQPDVVEKEPSYQDKNLKRKRTRESNVQGGDGDVEAEDRGRRTRRSDIGSHQVVPEPGVTNSSRTTKSNRRSEVVAVEHASSKLTKIPGGKRSKPSGTTSHAKKGASSTQTSTDAKKATRQSNGTSSAPSQTNKKGSNRVLTFPQVEAPPRKRKGLEKAESAPFKRQRIEKSPEAEVDLLNYQHLKAVTRNVLRQTIEAKWEALPRTAIDRIAQLLSDLQRPVIAHLNDERKKTQASTAVEAVARKLVRKFSRGLPFPPGTRNHREDDFDFEKILDHNRALEAQLTPALHSNELLEAELSKELAKLELDKELLAELETNAKSEASVRNQAARKLHSVLQPDESLGETELLNGDIGLNVDRQLQPLDLGVSLPFTEMFSFS